MSPAAQVARIARALLAGTPGLSTEALAAHAQLVCAVRRVGVDAATLLEVCARLREAG